MAACRDKLQAGLKELYARAVGITVRQARRDFAARPQPERFIRWLAEQRLDTAKAIGIGSQLTEVQSITAKVMTDPKVDDSDAPPPAAEDNLGALPEAERAMRMQWSIYTQAAVSWRKASRNGDESRALILGRNATDALRAYKVARSDWEQWQADNRLVVPIAETGSLEQALKSLAVLIQRMPDELCVNANPTAPSIARTAGEDWIQQRFTPTMAEIIDQLRTLRAV